MNSTDGLTEREKSGRTTTVSSFSIEPKLLAKAKRRAKSTNRSLSQHVQLLIERDLKEASNQPA